MPSLVGYKNMMPYSEYNPSLYPSSYLTAACLVSRTTISDGTTLAPDGVSLVHLWKRSSSGGTGVGCIHTSGWDYTLSEDTVFSVHAKEDSAEVIGLNIYLPVPAISKTCTYTWVDGVLTTTSKAAGVNSIGVEEVGDGWYRPWVHVTSSFYGQPVGTAIIPYMYYHHEADTEGYPQESTYLWGFQLEQGVERPTWYAHTTGQPRVEPMLVEFLDIKTEYTTMYARAHHNLTLSFKLIGEYL
jgi:hypothetical protein